MPYRKTTLRRMPPVTRRYAKLLGELDSVLRKGKNLVEEKHDPKLSLVSLKGYGPGNYKLSSIELMVKSL